MMPDGPFRPRLASGCRAACEEHRIGASRLALELGPLGHLRVPLDQGWDRADARDHPLVERPDRFGDLAVVRVDQQRTPLVVRVAEVTGEMNLAHPRGRK